MQGHSDACAQISLKVAWRLCMFRWQLCNALHEQYLQQMSISHDTGVSW